MSEALPKLANLMDIPADWAYQKMGIPKPKDGDVVLRGVQSLSENSAPADNQSGGKKAKLTALLERVTAENGEHPLEQLLGAELPDTTAAMEQALTPIFEAVRDGMTPDEVAEALLQAYPKMDMSQLEEVLTRAFFVADLWARVNPVDGTGVDHA